MPLPIHPEFISLSLKTAAYDADAHGERHCLAAAAAISCHRMVSLPTVLDVLASPPPQHTSRYIPQKLSKSLGIASADRSLQFPNTLVHSN